MEAQNTRKNYFKKQNSAGTTLCFSYAIRNTNSLCSIHSVVNGKYGPIRPCWFKSWFLAGASASSDLVQYTNLLTSCFHYKNTVYKLMIFPASLQQLWQFLMSLTTDYIFLQMALIRFHLVIITSLQAPDVICSLF